jgi:transposase
MRGETDPQMGLLTLTTPEKRVPADHPIREIKRSADAALRELDPVFDAMYAEMGRPSTPPKRLLKAQLLIAFYSIRSERQFCERLDYDLPFRFFLDMNLDDLTWDPSTFAKNRARAHGESKWSVRRHPRRTAERLCRAGRSARDDTSAPRARL